nr:proline-rich receptor-like protein kinase PERK9 [Lolium perenne]
MSLRLIYLSPIISPSISSDFVQIRRFSVRPWSKSTNSSSCSWRPALPGSAQWHCRSTGTAGWTWPALPPAVVFSLLTTPPPRLAPSVWPGRFRPQSSQLPRRARPPHLVTGHARATSNQAPPHPPAQRPGARAAQAAPRACLARPAPTSPPPQRARAAPPLARIHPPQSPRAPHHLAPARAALKPPSRRSPTPRLALHPLGLDHQQRPGSTRLQRYTQQQQLRFRPAVPLDQPRQCR